MVGVLKYVFSRLGEIYMVVITNIDIVVFRDRLFHLYVPDCSSSKNDSAIESRCQILDTTMSTLIQQYRDDAGVGFAHNINLLISSILTWRVVSRWYLGKTSGHLKDTITSQTTLSYRATDTVLMSIVWLMKVDILKTPKFWTTTRHFATQHIISRKE